MSEISTIGVIETGSSGSGRRGRRRETENELRVTRETLQSMLEKCQRSLELLGSEEGGDDSEESDNDDDSESVSSSQGGDSETAELCHLLKSRVESPNFLEKLGSMHMAIPNNMNEEISSWDMVSETDLWEGGNIDGENESDQDGYVLVRQEDIVEGIACFMASYLLSLKETKELTPNQLQEALSKTFSLKKKKGKLRKAWDGSKVIYNVASWSATAIGIYQNPALFKAASVAFWTSCRALSKLL